MTTELFADQLRVHYGFIYLQTDSPDPFVDVTDARRGQTNGLMGAAVAHRLHLVTGLHTGTVELTVTWSADEPPLDGEWEDVVDASLDVDSTDATLASFDTSFPLTLPATGPHRVRYSATGFDAGHAIDHADPGPDRYLLQLWPAPAEPDRIVRQTAANAAYWHRTAQETPAAAAPKVRQPVVEYVADAETGRHILVETDPGD